MMDNTHYRESSNLHIRENLLESISTDEGRGVFMRSPSAISAGASATGGCSIRGHKYCQYRIPKNTLTFLSQILVVYGIISVSVYHLSAQSPNQDLWLILLSSAFGYILPSPGLKYLKPAAVNSAKQVDSTTVDATDAAAPEEKKNDRRLI